MTGFSVEEIRIYAQKNPQTCQGKTDEEIISIMLSDKNLKLTEEQKQSLFVKISERENTEVYFLETSNFEVPPLLYYINKDLSQKSISLSEKQSLKFLENVFLKTEKDFEEQLQTEGKVSHFVNWIRKQNNAQNTRENIDDILKDTKTDIEFLKAAAEGQLVNKKNGEAIEFKDAFKTLRGVKYSEKEILKCQLWSQIYIQANMINEAIGQITKNLEKYSNGSTNLDYPKEFNKNIIKAFVEIGIKDKNEINKVLENINKKNNSEYKLIELGTESKKYYGQNYAIMYKNKEGRYLPLTSEQAKILGDEMQSKLQEVKKIMLGLPENATQEDCDDYVMKLKNNYKSAFKDAYGTKELTTLSEEYIIAQQKGVGYINMGVSLGAMVLAVFTGGVTATIATAVAMTQPMQILEKATDSKGFTDQDWQEYEKMLISQIPWMAAGMGMGKIGDIARSCVKLKGLQSVAQKTGQSLDDYINTVAKAGNLPDDVAKTLKSTRVLAETAGVSTEFALDVATTLAVYRDIKSEDWLMALAGALIGSKMNAKLSKMGTPELKAQFLIDSFKELKLTPDEANKIIKAMDKIAEETPDNVNKPSREELKSTIMKGKKINGAQKEINIPKGGLEAPRAGFGETTTDYVNIIKNNELEIIDMVSRYENKEITFEELANEYISLLQKGMDLQVMPDVRSYTTNSRFAGSFNPLHVRVSYSLDGLSGNVSDLFATITHEFHHLMQTKEMILTDFDKFIETMAEANNITDIDGLKNVAVENWLDFLVHYSENADPNSPYTQRGQALLSANKTYTTNDIRQYIQNLKEVETHEVQINIAIEMKHLLNEIDDNTYQVTKDVYTILQHYCDEDVALLKAKEYFETGSINDFVNYCQRALNDGLNPNEIVIKMMDDFTPQEPAKKQNFFSRLFKHS